MADNSDHFFIILGRWFNYITTIKKKQQQKKEAIQLRIIGYSYNEISKILNVSKGSLSLWLHDIQLNNNAQQRLLERIKTVHIYNKDTGEKISKALKQ